LARPDWRRRPGVGAVVQGAVTPQIAGGGHRQDGEPGDRGAEAGLGVIQAEAVLAEVEVFRTGQRNPAARISRSSGASSPVM
jgi:hypothetical protein